MVCAFGKRWYQAYTWLCRNNERVKRNLEQIGARSRRTVHLVTHQHFDHVGGVMKLLDHGFGTELWAPLPQETVPPTGDITASDLYNERFPGTRVDRFLHDGEVLRFGDVVITVIATPGHAPDHACYLISWRGHCVGIFGDIDGGHSERVGGDLETRARSIARLQDQRCTEYVEGHGSLEYPLRPRAEFSSRMKRFGEKLKPGFGYLFDPMHR